MDNNADCDLKLASGKPQQAEELLQQALSEFPNSHYALGKLAMVRIQQKRYDEAVQLYLRRYEAAPHAENLYDPRRSIGTCRQA